MIINSYDEYEILKTRIKQEKCILTPILRDIHHHPAENSVLCVAITFMNKETYVVSVSHPDARPYTIPESDNIIEYQDILTLAYVSNTMLPEMEYTPYVNSTYYLYNKELYINKIVPIMIWSTILKKYNNKLVDIFMENQSLFSSDKFLFTKQLISTLRTIESSGIYTDKKKLISYFGDKVERTFPTNFVYSQYNPYTTTGRPSNRFGGINFSALNKNDGSRDCFISRYQNGILVQLDFEAYHLRLVADELNITLPSTSIHRELAKLYFNTTEITDELYSKSKQKTFEIMYGMSDETYGFELFEQIHARRQYFKGKSTVKLPSGIDVTVDDPTPSKLYNYSLQSLEIVKTLPKLEKIIHLVKNTTCHLTLYTYDSILLDCEKFDSTLIRDIQEILEESDKFPVRVYTGTTYGNIKEVKE